MPRPSRAASRRGSRRDIRWRPEDAMSKVIGIDLGTTNSVVAAMEGGSPAVIPNQEGSRLTPSVVALTREGEILVGQVVKRRAITVVRTSNGDVRVEIRGKQYSPRCRPRSTCPSSPPTRPGPSIS
jgi:hypothetical protein